MPPQSFSESGEPLESTSGGPYETAGRALRWLFFATGLPVGMLIPRLAEIKAGLGADNASYGTAIAIGGAGAFLGSWLGGRATHAWGSKAVAQWAIGLILLANIANALAPSVLWLAAIAFMGGASFSFNNIAVNSQAVLVEQGLGRSYVPRAHAFWSLGTMLAALVSSLIAPFTTPLQALCFGAVVSLGLYASASGRLLTTEHEDRPEDDASQLARGERIPRGAFLFLAALAVAQTLGLVAEMSVGDWSSVLLKQEFGVPVGPNGYGFTAFMTVQLLTRFIAPRFIDRFGMAVTVRTLGLVGTSGYLLALAAASTVASGSYTRALVLSCLAYASLGLAVGTMPSAFTTAAGAIPGLPAARALTSVGLMVAATSMLGRITIANVAELVPLTSVLLGIGGSVLIAVSMTFVLVPERAERHAIQREEQS